MQPVVWELLVETGFLDWDDFEKLICISPEVHRLKGEGVALYRQIHSLLSYLSMFSETTNRHGVLWWDSEISTTTFSPNFWPPVDTPLLLTIYYAALIRALPCPMARIEDDKMSWPCVVHPDILTIKHFPNLDGKVYIPTGADSSTLQLCFHINFRTYATTVTAYSWWKPVEIDDINTRIDCELLQKLFAAKLSLFDARVVTNIVMDLK